MFSADPYAPHRAYVAPARDGGPLWQVAVGLGISEAVFAFSPMILFPIYGDGLWDILAGETAWTLFVSLSLYCLPALAIALWITRVHGRSALTVIGPPKTALRHMLVAGGGVALALLALEVIPPLPALRDFESTRPLLIWLLILPFAAFAIMVQSGSEELIFRGYLQQQLAAVSDRPIVWMALPSLLFGYLHYGNAEGAYGGVLYVFWAFCLGMACADLTARTGNIGAAIGLHTVNNIFVFCLYGMTDGPDSGFALFLYPFSPPQADPGAGALISGWAIYDAISSILFIGILWLAARIALRR